MVERVILNHNDLGSNPKGASNASHNFRNFKCRTKRVDGRQALMVRGLAFLF
jgi:hypothetical protein